jgi:hypothetical protein
MNLFFSSNFTSKFIYFFRIIIIIIIIIIMMMMMMTMMKSLYTLVAPRRTRSGRTLNNRLCTMQYCQSVLHVDAVSLKQMFPPVPYIKYLQEVLIRKYLRLLAARTSSYLAPSSCKHLAGQVLARILFPSSSV